MLTMRRRAAVLAVASSALVPLAMSSAGQQPAVVGGDASTRPAADSVGLAPLVGPQRRPNIVVIMADDMRADDLQYMPKTRKLIGRKGTRFKNAFSPYPLCCPARASFLTGQYSHNHKVWSHTDPWGFGSFRDDQTLPVWLEDAGYNTAFLGKYLNGYGRQPLPDGSPSATYVPPGWMDWRAAVDGGLSDDDREGGDTGGTYRYFDTTLNVNGILDGNGGRYQTRLFGDHSAQAIARYAPSHRPFFLWASYVAPHHGQPRELDDPATIRRGDGTRQRFATPARPGDVRGKFDWLVKGPPGATGEKDVSDKPFFIRRLPEMTDQEHRSMVEVARQRAEAVSVLDGQVARTVRALKRSGELARTMVMVTSDNGYFLGEHRMRSGKILPYDPSLRIPLLVRGPKIPQGTVREDPFLMIDFAPTLLSAARAPAEDSIDGVNMLPTARRGDRGWTRGVLTETGPRKVKADIEESDNWLVQGEGRTVRRFSQGVRTARYLYVEHASWEQELYDMQVDPDQLHNLAGRPQMARVEHHLARALDRLRHCRGEGCTRPVRESLQGP